MEESILDTIKMMLGITSDETAFDMDITVLINAAFMTLKQLGVGPTTGFSITNANAIWSDFFDNEAMLGSVQSYIYMKVRVAFDPPSGSVLSAYQESIREFEWRMNVEVDPNYEGYDDNSGSSSNISCTCGEKTTDEETLEMLKDTFKD